MADDKDKDLDKEGAKPPEEGAAPDPEDLEAQGIDPRAKAFLPENLQEVLTRPLTEEDIYYLLGRYPYLELCDVNNPARETGVKPKLIRGKTGWYIHDFGNYLTASAGVYAYGFKSLKEVAKEYGIDLKGEEGEGGGEGVLKPGTLVMQFYVTAHEMIQMAKDRWPQAEVVGGYYPMIRAAWMAAQKLNYDLEGFTPTVEDEVVYEWDQRIRAHKGPRGPMPEGR